MTLVAMTTLPLISSACFSKSAGAPSAVFLFPWAVVYRDLARENRLFPFTEMFIFIALVLAGFFYIWKKGALDWAAEEIEKVRRPERARVEETPAPDLVAHE
jgi:hypothetical protein